jgi:hypothetical protein
LDTFWDFLGTYLVKNWQKMGFGHFKSFLYEPPPNQTLHEYIYRVEQ